MCTVHILPICICTVYPPSFDIQFRKLWWVFNYNLKGTVSFKIANIHALNLTKNVQIPISWYWKKMLLIHCRYVRSATQGSQKLEDFCFFGSKVKWRFFVVV